MPLGNDGEWYAPHNWDDAETEMYLDLIEANPELAGNGTVELYYHTAYFETNSGLTQGELEVVRDDLHRYLEREYGIDWDTVFDWEAYREAYDQR